MEEERVATPPSNQEFVLEENVSDPPASEVEVNNLEAATNINTEANDVVMAKATVAPEATAVPEVQAPKAPAAPEANTEAHEANVAPEAQINDNVNAPVPPPRPHTIELAFDHGQPVMVRWPILTPPPAVGPQFEYHVEHRPQVQKPKPRLPRFPGTATSPGVFTANGFMAHNTFFNSSKNPYTRPRISSDQFWSYQ